MVIRSKRQEFCFLNIQFNAGKAGFEYSIGSIWRTTYTIDIAEALGKLIDRRYRGVVHFANEGVCSRYELRVRFTDTE
jgi:dTDP-4-dehydrorhamnose reductase